MIFHFLKTSYAKIKTALSKARSFLGDKITLLLQGPINEDVLEKIERTLYEADFGVKTASELTDRVRALHKKNPNFQAKDYINDLREYLIFLLNQRAPNQVEITHDNKPHVILIVGVNGNGKTTSVAKLARLCQQSGQSVLLGAADTFRAAAVEQLELWSKQLGVDIVKGHSKGDPAAVAFDTIQAGRARGSDVVIIDTAGRLHTKTPLMQELEKIRRSCQKAAHGSPHETLLVLDSTVGQNAIEQAKLFNQFIPLTGLVLTKLDGTAKGGIVVAIQRELNIPVKFIGVGEGIDDLHPFDPESFVSNLFE